MAGQVAVPLVEGVWVYAQADYEEPIRLMEPVLHPISGVGGSNAQHEVFIDTLQDAYLRTERYQDADAMLRKSMEAGTTPRDYLRLGRAQLGLGRIEEASTSLREAVQRWPDADPSSPELATIGRLTEQYALDL